jgi:hypothetical protein
MVDSLSDTLRKHSAAMTEQGFPDKAAILAEAADLTDKFGMEKARDMLDARVREKADPAHADRIVGEEAELIGFAVQWMNYYDR